MINLEIWYFLISGAIGVAAGYGISIKSGSPYDKFEQTNDPGLGIFVNTGTLYATLALIIGTVVSEWPPEGQEQIRTASTLEDVVFYFSVIFTAAIITRILALIWYVERGPQNSN